MEVLCCADENVRPLWWLLLFWPGFWLRESRRAWPRIPGVLMPDESARRAKQLLEQVVDALGGTAYLNVHHVTCAGRLSQFGHSGELNGFEKFEDYAVPPDKDRTENLPQRNIIQVFNGDKGWTLDRGGVSEAAATDVAHFEEDARRTSTPSCATESTNRG